jgi:hypothetical protein
MSQPNAKPVRLRLSRKRGFNLQKLALETNGLAAVVVSRPSRWGNPHKLRGHNREDAIARYEAGLKKQFGDMLGKALQPLRGKNLACWCPLDKPCHADVLLRLANGTTVDRRSDP